MFCGFQRRITPVSSVCSAPLAFTPGLLKSLALFIIHVFLNHSPVRYPRLRLKSSVGFHIVLPPWMSLLFHSDRSEQSWRVCLGRFEASVRAFGPTLPSSRPSISSSLPPSSIHPFLLLNILIPPPSPTSPRLLMPHHHHHHLPPATLTPPPLTSNTNRGNGGIN